MKHLIIIPAYNESECIEQTVMDIIKKAPDFDYIVINDCSTDNTSEICHRNHFHIIDLPSNLGIGGAVQTGYLYAARNGYDIAVQVDGDGLHDPVFLNDMAQILEREDCDMVIGSRFLEKHGFQSSGIRRVGIRYFTYLIKALTGRVITDPTSGLRMRERSGGVSSISPIKSIYYDTKRIKAYCTAVTENLPDEADDVLRLYA